MLVDELSPAISNWEALGRALGVSDDLEIIRSCYSYPGDRLKVILREWLKLGRPNWRGVLRALRTVGEDKVAKKLKVKYGESSTRKSLATDS